MPIAGASELVDAATRKGLRNPDSSEHPGIQVSDIQFQQHDPHLDNEALQQVANCIQQTITPVVAIEPLDAQPWCGRYLHQPECLLCDIAGAIHLFDSEAGLLRAAARQLDQMGIVARMAITDSAGSAWALSHYANSRDQAEFALQITFERSEDAESHLTTPIASQTHFIVPSHRTEEALSRLPVQSLRVAEQTVSTLHRLGVESVGQLLRLPRGGLATRLGTKLVDRLAQALSETDEPLNTHQAMASHAHSLDLEYPTSDEPILTNRIDQLCRKLVDGLAASHRGALRVKCCLVITDHPPLSFDIGLFAPSQDSKQLACLLSSCLQSHRLSSDVKRITIEATLSQSMQCSQVALFDDESQSIGKTNLALPRLVNALSGRLGRDAVVGVSMSRDPLPEKSYRLSPLTGTQTKTRSRRRDYASQSPSSKSPTSFCPLPSDPVRRPLDLLASPIPLSVVGDSFHLPARIPVAFRLGGKVHRIIRFWGPERIETGWWDGPSIRRDYYRVETDKGHLWWIFRSLSSCSTSHGSSNDWMLHGKFN